MKKFLVVACFSLVALASCNVKNSDEYKAMQAERDSLMQVSAKSNTELTDMMAIISEVEDNFNQLKEAEKYLTIESKNKAEMSRDTKTRIKDNFEMVNEIIQKNKTEIARLNQKLKATGTNNANAAGLQKTVDRLNKQLEESVTAIEDLRKTLATRNAEIAQLKSNVDVLNKNVDQLANQAEVQASKIVEQDEELNAGYYIFGTSSELKQAKVVSGSFLSSNKIMKEGIEKSKFVKVDIRLENQIPVMAKKAKLLSDHPKGSYEIVKDSEGRVIVKILDHTRFWSLTRFLVIQV